MDRSTLPPLDLVGPDGDRLTVRALDRADTVGVLARRLGTDTLWTTDRELDPGERLADIDELRVGARLGIGASPATTGSAASEPPLVEVAVVAGPSTTTWQSLPAGRHLIGRAAHATVRLDDPAIEPHHALLRVDDDGQIEVVQLTGVVPIRVDGRPWEAAVVDDDTDLTIGASVIRVRRRPAGCCHHPASTRTVSSPICSVPATTGARLGRGASERPVATHRLARPVRHAHAGPRRPQPRRSRRSNRNDRRSRG